MRAKFWIKLLLAVLVLAAFNGFIHLAQYRSVPNLVLHRLEAGNEAKILFLGNSLMDAGLDLPEMKEAWPGTMPVALNGALGASDGVGQDLLFHVALTHHPETTWVVYGYFDFQLTRSAPYDWSLLMGNMNLGFKLDAAKAVQFYGLAPGWERERFFLTGYIPMIVERAQVWNWAERFRRLLAQWGMPPEEANRFGRAADFKQLEAANAEAFAQNADEDVAAQASWIPPLQDLFQAAKEKGLHVVVVEMPQTPDHQERFYHTASWQAYRAYVQKKLELDGMLYVNASDWVSQDSDFADAIHLNSKGAKIFSRKLATKLAAELQP